MYTTIDTTTHIAKYEKVERSTNGQGFYISEEIECSYVVWPLVALKGFFLFNVKTHPLDEPQAKQHLGVSGKGWLVDKRAC